LGFENKARKALKKAKESNKKEGRQNGAQFFGHAHKTEGARASTQKLEKNMPIRHRFGVKWREIDEVCKK